MADDDDDKVPYGGANMATPPGVDDDDDESSIPQDGSGDVEDTDDGGAVVSFDDEENVDEEEADEHFSNLAETLPDDVLRETAVNLLDLIERDREARKRRDEQYAEGIQRTGLGDDAPGGAAFEGASKVVHPMLTKVCIDFAARAMKELFPPDGNVVKDFIPGTPTKQKLERAGRKTRWMNWQLTKGMPEFRAELEQTVTQVPLGGAQYMKFVWDRRLKRSRSHFVPIDDIFLPYSAASFLSAERRTHRQFPTDLEYKRNVSSGVWRDADMLAAETPEVSESAEASAKVEGKEDDAFNPDGLRTVYETACWLDIEEEDEFRPYLVTIDDSSRHILSVYRNWLPNDEKFEELHHIVEFPFVPWRGAYPIGLPHIIGGLSAATTGALRALLDSAHINNFPSAMRLKGGATPGQSVDMQPGEIKTIEGSFEQDDIRKVIMPVPFNQPSPVLYELLGFLVQEGNGVIQTTFEELGDQKRDMPVGTTLALIEQGMTVFSAIHARLHAAMKQALAILHRLNQIYLEDEEVVDDVGELMVKRSDFQGPMDVIPVSDPNIFSEAQRFAQVQVVAQRAQQNPLYDQREVELLILERLKLPNAKSLLVPKPEPQHMNAVNENMAAVMGRPIVAFPEQDHLAHLLTHAQIIMHPLYGGNPLIAPKLIGTLLPHLAEHLGFLYVTSVFDKSSEAIGGDISKYIDTKDPDLVKEFDQTMVAASQAALAQLTQNQNLMQLLQVIQKGMQYMQSMQQPGPMDPSQVAAMDVQRKSKADEQKAQTDQQKAQVDAQRVQIDAQRAQIDQQRLQLEDQREHAQIGMEQQRLHTEEVGRYLDADMRAKDQQTRVQIAGLTGQQRTQQTEMTNQMHIATNTADNDTAMTIARWEIEEGRKTNLKDGDGINPGDTE